jgi:internalin A
MRDKAETLSLAGLGLTALPSEIGQLTQLQGLYLRGNPLSDVILGAYQRGLKELLVYLHSLGEIGKPLYEAKLVFVGEGGVGKTTLLEALRGKPFVEDRPTTHGVEIERQPLELDHPNQPGTKIKLNAWDFGGQPVYRITHQFFSSRRALYLLLWNPRMSATSATSRGGSSESGCVWVKTHGSSS